jgi:hypothetical protein
MAFAALLYDCKSSGGAAAVGNWAEIAWWSNSDRDEGKKNRAD